MVMPVQFDRPGWLLVTLLVLPAIAMAWRGLRQRGPRGRAISSTIARCLLLVMLAVALARPIWARTGSGVTVVAVLDRSRSIPRSVQDRAVDLLRRWTDPRNRGDDDRLAVLSVGGDSAIAAMPDRSSILEPAVDEPRGDATNLAEGIRLALAILPRDTSSRILLVSDGNETEESVLSVADLAVAAGVPIDVVALEYEHRQEVLVERVAAPGQARQGQVIPVRVVLRSLAPASGVLHLHRNGIEVDLDPDSDARGMALALNPGVNAVVFDLPVDASGPQRFDATWEPAAGTDTITANNRGVAVTFASRGGAVLLVTEDVTAAEPLQRALVEAGVTVDMSDAASMPRDSIALSSYDAVILADVPRWAMDDAQERHLHAFVQDLGGGLVLSGGPSSFGAGGWIGSLLEEAMPLRCEPPQTRQLPSGALALIMHSCEIPRGNYWGQQVASAAIEAVSSKDHIGIIEYNWDGGSDTINNAGWTLRMQLAGDKSAALAAVNRLTLGDMTDFESSMRLALDGVTSVDASQRHVIIISDGDPHAPTTALLQEYRDAAVTVSTVMVGAHGAAMNAQHRQAMRAVAAATGGRFYDVNDPAQLPRIFVKESQLNARALIQEGRTWTPARVAVAGGPVDDVPSVPTVDGYVVTAARGGLSQTPWVIATRDAEDPLYAWWHYGLGKSVAFTSDLGRRWALTWPQWSDFSAFWERTVRWAMRSAAPSNMLVTTRTEGETAIVELEAMDAGAAFLNFLDTRAVVIDPQGEAQPISLQQTGPGRYRSEFRVAAAGAWLVNIAFQDAEGTGGAVRAAVTVPYAREYRATSHNAALLARVAERTNGRVVRLDELDLHAPFDGTGLAIPVSPQPVWDLLAMAALALLVIDVALRRLWIDRREVQALLAPVSKASTASVEALRRVRATRPTEAAAVEPDLPLEPQPPPKSVPKAPKRPSVDDREDSLGQLLKRKRRRGEDDQ